MGVSVHYSTSHFRVVKRNYFGVLLATILFQCKSTTSDHNVRDTLIINTDTISSINKVPPESFGRLINDLGKYNGFYSSIESVDGIISLDNLPIEIQDDRIDKICSTKIDYLEQLKHGYLLAFGIDYCDYSILVISTLDSRYNYVDHRTYINGLNKLDVKEDTIAIPVYDKSSITIEIMHPSEAEEPQFSINGIRREHIRITDDLKIVNAR